MWATTMLCLTVGAASSQTSASRNCATMTAAVTQCRTMLGASNRTGPRAAIEELDRWT
jgi:hypothetical protein